jgi:endonuclease NucS-like protein
MPRYWVVAPYEAENLEAFNKVWQFDLANNLISIGWSAVGDVSKMSSEEIGNAVASAYPNSPPATRALYRNMLWNFCHEILPGDIVVARRGQKIVAGVGKVTQSAVYAPGRDPGIDHPRFLGVEWQGDPRDKAFPTLVFPRYTVKEISGAEYRSLLDGSGTASAGPEPTEEIDQTAFALEKHLEDFIVANFETIFKGKLQIYKDAKDAEVDGQQYATEVGPIDILAVERSSGAFVVIELKKGRPSDQVVGQILRYMGWVKKNLCKEDQAPKGLVICNEPDPKLSYALAMTTNVELRYYKVSFTLS